MNTEITYVDDVLFHKKVTKKLPVVKWVRLKLFGYVEISKPAAMLDSVFLVHCKKHDHYFTSIKHGYPPKERFSCPKCVTELEENLKKKGLI